MKDWLKRHPAVAFTLALCLTATVVWAADTAISALTAGDPPVRADEFPVNRAGVNRKLTIGGLVDLAVHLASSFAVTAISDAPSADTNNYNPTNWDGTEPLKATQILISPTISMLLTGLTGGTTGRIATLTNATDGSASTSVMILLPHESSASTAANRFRWPDQQAYWLLGGDSIDIVWDDTIDRWRPLGAFVPLGAGRFTVFDDFTTQSAGGSGNYVSSVAGTASTCQVGTYLNTSATQSPIGAIQCDSGTTATGRSGLRMAGADTTGIVPAQGQALFLSRVAVETLSTSTERYQMWLGWHDVAGAGTTPTDGVYWRYQDDVSAIWQICTEDATAQQCTTLGAGTVDTNYIWLMIYVSGDWQNADFFHSFDGLVWVNDGSPASQNPPEAADTLNVQATMTKSVGITSRNWDLDLMAFRLDLIRGT